MACNEQKYKQVLYEISTGIIAPIENSDEDNLCGEIFNDYDNNIASGNYSHAEGFNTQANGVASHSEGRNTIANGNASHAEGVNTVTNNEGEHAQGMYNISHNGNNEATQTIHSIGIGSSGNCKNAIEVMRDGTIYIKGIGGYEGNDINENILPLNDVIYNIETNNNQVGEKTVNNGEIFNSYDGEMKNTANNYSHAEGYNTKADGNYSHAEGFMAQSLGDYSHTEGFQTLATGNSSHAEGYITKANGNYSHTEGFQTSTNNNYAHSEGFITTANGIASHAEGYQNNASGKYSHAEGNGNTANGESSHVEGNLTIANGNYSHTEGNQTLSDGESSHAEGYKTSANTAYSHAEGYLTSANASASHAEGYSSQSSGFYSHAEGNETKSIGDSSHAEGKGSVASGESSHAEGYTTIASGNYSHAEGNSSQSISDSSHAEGINTYASGIGSHAEGNNTQAIGESSHAEGNNTQANGNYSHTSGNGTIANNQSEFVLGEFNNSVEESIFTIGIGENNENRSNALVLLKNGELYLKGVGGYSGNNIDDSKSINAQLDSANSVGKFYIKDGEILGEIFNNYDSNIASGNYSHAEGNSTKAVGNSSHSEGNSSQAKGDSSHAEGFSTQANGEYSHAEGRNTIVNAQFSHVEGDYSQILDGSSCHAEGNSSIGKLGYYYDLSLTNNNSLHSEGFHTMCCGDYGSHAEGSYSTASGEYAHAEGGSTIAYGEAVHSEGHRTISIGHSSHSEGTDTIAFGNSTKASGFGLVKYDYRIKKGSPVNIQILSTSQSNDGIYQYIVKNSNQVNIFKPNRAYKIKLNDNNDFTPYVAIYVLSSWTIDKSINEQDYFIQILNNPFISIKEGENYSVYSIYDNGAFGDYSNKNGYNTLALGKSSSVFGNVYALDGNSNSLYFEKDKLNTINKTTVISDEIIIYSNSITISNNYKISLEYVSFNITQPLINNNDDDKSNYLENIKNYLLNNYFEIKIVNDSINETSYAKLIDITPKFESTTPTGVATYYAIFTFDRDIFVNYTSFSECNLYLKNLGKSSIFNGALNQSSYVINEANTACGIGAHAEGALTIANGNYSHAEGLGVDYYYLVSDTFKWEENEIICKVDDFSYDYNISDSIFNGNKTKIFNGGDNLITYTLQLNRLKKDNYKGIYYGMIKYKNNYIIEKIDLPEYIDGIETYFEVSSKENIFRKLQIEDQLCNLTSNSNIILTITLLSFKDIYGAIGSFSHSEGVQTLAAGYASHSEGCNTIANNSFEHACGMFNASITEEADVNNIYGTKEEYDTKLSNVDIDESLSAKTLSSIGIGFEKDLRQNAFEIKKNGDIYIKNIGNFNGVHFNSAKTLQTVINELTSQINVLTQQLTSLQSELNILKSK